MFYSTLWVCLMLLPSAHGEYGPIVHRPLRRDCPVEALNQVHHNASPGLTYNASGATVNFPDLKKRALSKEDLDQMEEQLQNDSRLLQMATGKADENVPVVDNGQATENDKDSEAKEHAKHIVKEKSLGRRQRPREHAWACPMTTRWVDLGMYAFPRFVQETVCGRVNPPSLQITSPTCMRGHYQCQPTTMVVQILVSHVGNCYDSQVPVAIRERYFLSRVNISTACYCR